MNEKSNLERIEELRNIHKGERCVIIGLGPSLNKTNMNLIKDEICWGVNSFFEYGHKKFGVYPQYYACSDPVTWKYHADKLLQLNTTLFLGGAAFFAGYAKNLDYYKKIEKYSPIIINHLGFMWQSKRFCFEPSIGAYNGDTIIIDIPLQVCMFMGFKEIILIGCDCEYGTVPLRFDGTLTEPSNSLAAQGNWNRIFSSYETCKKVYDTFGRKIINCTVGGKLEIFERKALEDVI